MTEREKARAGTCPTVALSYWELFGLLSFGVFDVT